jgi:UDP-N-acetylmuramate dehydrogenase
MRPPTKPTWPSFSRHTPRDIPVYPIGVGSNMLVRDGGVPGVVIRMGRGFGPMWRLEEGTGCGAGTAVPDIRVARFAADNGIDGLTFLRGIPGTIGGALRMNGGPMAAKPRTC